MEEGMIRLSGIVFSCCDARKGPNQTQIIHYYTDVTSSCEGVETRAKGYMSSDGLTAVACVWVCLLRSAMSAGSNLVVRLS